MFLLHLYKKWHLVLIVQVLLTLILGTQVLSAQENFCDQSLNINSDHPFGYQNRGNRCEGIYIQQVSGSTLRVVSFTESFENYDLGSNRDLLIEWTPMDNQALHIRAYSLKRKVYYRMDTLSAVGSMSYTWPSNVLKAYDIKKKNMGVIAWSQSFAGNFEGNIYLPIRIRQQKDPVKLKEYKLILVPGRELLEVYIGLKKLATGEKAETIIHNSEPLKYGYYPAGLGLTIPVAKITEHGVYHIEIGATLRGGGSVTKDIWFYHPKDGKKPVRAVDN